MEFLTAFEKGNYSQIIQEWQSNQRSLITDPEAAYIVAAAYFRLENYDAANSLCEGLLSSFSNNPNFLAMYAAILRRLMLLDRAEEIFKKALLISPKALDVRNNYSNLLIDQSRFAEARTILDKVLEENPEYYDAKINLQRLEDLEEEQKTLTINSKDKTTEGKSLLGDPLDNAFEVSEVMKCGSKLGSVTAAINDILPTPTTSELDDGDLELIHLASDQIKTNQFNGALELIQKVRERKGAQSLLYKIASDAAIGLKRFGEAEVHALYAFINGERSIANYLNLASLSAMRKDQLMSRHWLNEAQKINPNDENLKQSRELLFPDGKARELDTPYISNI